MELTQAQTTWLSEFESKVADLQADYHFWQNAEDRRRLNRQAEEQDRLNHEATVKQNRHTDAMRHFTQWIQAHPYPAADQTADQTAPTQAQTQTVADSLREVNRLANLAEDKEQYRSGWNDAMEGVKDIQRRGKSPQDWAQRMCHIIGNNDWGAYNRGSKDALTHFLESGQTDRHAP